MNPASESQIQHFSALESSWDFSTGKGLSPDTQAAWKPQVAALILKAKLAEEETFWEQVAAVRTEYDRPEVRPVLRGGNPLGVAWGIAKRYGTGPRRREVIARILLDAAQAADREGAMARLWRSGFCVPPHEPTQRGPYGSRPDFLKKMLGGSELIARHGASKCLQCGSAIQFGKAVTWELRNGDIGHRELRFRYCHDHEETANLQRHRQWMDHTFREAWAAVVLEGAWRRDNETERPEPRLVNEPVREEEIVGADPSPEPTRPWTSEERQLALRRATEDGPRPQGVR